MNPVRKKRLIIVLAILFGVVATVSIGLVALQENINLFYTPDQIVKGEAPKNIRIRAGGLVKVGSVQREDDLNVRFVVTDGKGDVTIRYKGILPDLFREGQGIVALGELQQDGSLQASEVLAKHDEKYMPPEVTHALEQSGMLDQHNAATGKDKK